MKRRIDYGIVKKKAEVFHYQFFVKIGDDPRILQNELDHMYELVKREAQKKGHHVWDYTVYRRLTEDRRHNKTIPKGYRMHRYSYTHRSNFTFVPYNPLAL